MGKTLRVLRARADWLTHLDDPLRPPYEIGENAARAALALPTEGDEGVVGR